MDTSAIPFNLSGDGCNYCETARLLQNRESKAKTIDEVFAEIKQGPKSSSSAYDAIVGVSGGLDSSYLLHKGSEFGLRLLAVHMDNCWNAATATHNLSKLVDKLEVDLHSIVVDWEIQRQLQLAFLNANVVDVDLLYDNALHAVCFDAAKKFNVKTILGGANLASEGVEVARNWAWYPFDGTNIRGIASKSGASTNNYPIFTFGRYLKSTFFEGVRWLSPLSRDLTYKREFALDILSKKYDFQDYGNKHYENVFTRVYQGIILVEKFGIDKRKAHLSSLIMSGQMSRGQALRELQEQPYPDPRLRELDINFFCERLRISRDQFESYLTEPGRSHEEFGSDRLFSTYRAFLAARRKFLIRAQR